MCIEYCKSENIRKQREKINSYIASCRLQPKTPTGAPEALFYMPAEGFAIDDILDALLPEEPELRTEEKVREVQKHFKGMEQYKAYMILDNCPIADEDGLQWAEDYFHIYRDGSAAISIPPVNSEKTLSVIMQGQTERLKDDNVNLDKVLTPSYTSTKNVYCRNAGAENCKKCRIQLMKSYIDGGNMLPAEDFVLIGKDALKLTCVLNGIDEDKAKALIAGETGYPEGQIYFVEQPYYHLDLAMLYLGKNGDKQQILVKKDNRGIPLDLIHQQLRGFGLDVIVDEECVAGKDSGEASAEKQMSLPMQWEYNFFNGEYMKYDSKLYYVTNGIDEETNQNAADIKNKFEVMLKSKVPGLEKVIFSESSNQLTLNQTHGGIGCRFKGGPLQAAEILCEKKES